MQIEGCCVGSVAPGTGAVEQIPVLPIGVNDRRSRAARSKRQAGELPPGKLLHAIYRTFLKRSAPLRQVPSRRFMQIIVGRSSVVPRAARRERKKT